MKKTKILFTTSLIIFLMLLAIMLINIHIVQPLDNAIRVVVNAHRTVGWNNFFTHFTQLFNSHETVIWTVITIIVAFFLVNLNFGLQVTLTIGTGILLNRAVKLLIKRPRPSVNILMHYGSYSFPSGHSAASALILGSLVLVVWQVVKRQWLRNTLTILLILLVLAIGFSRIYVGAHYPSDVLAGWCSGTVVVTGYQLLFHRSSK